MSSKDARGGRKSEEDEAIRRAVGEFIEVLQSEDLTLRERALKTFHADLLPEVQERIVRALMLALDGKKQERSHAAAITLSQIGDPAVDALSQAFLSARNAGRRLRLIRVLLVISMTHPVVPLGHITRALADPDPTVRLVALKGVLMAAETRNRAAAGVPEPAAAGDEREP